MILCSSLITHIGYATPLADYSPGKITTDMTWYPSLKITNSYSTPNSTTSKTSTADGKSGNFDFSLTAGLSGKWALQYRQFNPETITYVNSTLLQNFGMKTQELNVLYKIDKSIAAFAGWHQASYTYGANFAPNITAQNKNVLQVGLIGATQIADKTQLFAVAGVGKALINIEAGIS